MYLGGVGDLLRLGGVGLLLLLILGEGDLLLRTGDGDLRRGGDRLRIGDLYLSRKQAVYCQGSFHLMRKTKTFEKIRGLNYLPLLGDLDLLLLHRGDGDLLRLGGDCLLDFSISGGIGNSKCNIVLKVRNLQ